MKSVREKMLLRFAWKMIIRSFSWPGFQNFVGKLFRETYFARLVLSGPKKVRVKIFDFPISWHWSTKRSEFSFKSPYIVCQPSNLTLTVQIEMRKWQFNNVRIMKVVWIYLTEMKQFLLWYLKWVSQFLIIDKWDSKVLKPCWQFVAKYIT